MILSLIGMSNVGKTYWSKKLELLGFTRFGCDDEIEKRLGVKDLAAWLGFPDRDGYREREQTCLSTEANVLRDVLDRMGDNDVVIDTTGSVIYLPEDLLKRLKEKTKVVYLQANEQAIELMIEKFFDIPKALIWGEHFVQRNGEDRDNALKRCYPELLKWRQEKYVQIADLIIPV